MHLLGNRRLWVLLKNVMMECLRRGTPWVPVLRGGAVVLKLRLSTDMKRCNPVNQQSRFGKQWRNYWRNRAQPCGNACVFSVIMTVTKRTRKISPRSKLPCTEKDRRGCLVSGFAIVVDAAAARVKKCPASRLKACRAMTWFADSIVRDALADVRFNIAKSIA